MITIVVNYLIRDREYGSICYAETIADADQFAKVTFGSIPYTVSEAGNFRYYFRADYSNHRNNLASVGFQIKGFEANE